MTLKRDLMLGETGAPRGIRPSRFVAGIALHFAVPAYLIWLAVALIPQLGSASRDELARTAGHASVLFLIVYAIFLVAITLATQALEPALRQARERREERNPEAAPRLSTARVNGALRTAASLPGGPNLNVAIERLRSAPWRHDDQRFQAIAYDLARTAKAFGTAVNDAAPDERTELQDLAAATFNRIAEAVEQLSEEQRRLDHGDARTLARYIELRYPSSEFTSGKNS